MQYISFYQKLSDLPFFGKADILRHFPNFRSATLSDWQQKQYITKLRNNLYIFTEKLPTADPYRVANRLCKPSYISLQSALSAYNWIPEQTFAITSITTLKTQNHENQMGHFIYRSISKDLYTGYYPKEQTGPLFALPQKALLDLIWLEGEPKHILDQLEGWRIDWQTVRQQTSFENWEPYLKLFSFKNQKIFQALTPIIEQLYK